MALVLILTSCNAVEMNDVNSTNIQQNMSGNIDKNNSDGINYEINKATFANKEIKINYPQVSNLSDKAKQKVINEIIKKDALSNFNKDIYEDYSLEISYDIKWKSTNLLSIEYNGVGYDKGAAHPNNEYYTSNIDIKNGVSLRLQDVVKIDEVLIKKIKKSKCTRSCPEAPELDFAIKEKFDNLSTDEMLKNLNYTDSNDSEHYSSAYSYFTKDSLGISISFSHVYGDHLEFEFKYKDIANNIKTKNEVCNDFPSLVQSLKTEAKENLNDLKKNGLEVIKNQSFEIELKKWGKVKFVTATLSTNPKLVFFLVDDKGTVLYSFSDLVENSGWNLSEVRAVSFRDVNKDGLKDIMIIADYITGVGKTGVIPFHQSKIYFQKENKFVCIPELDEEINERQQNENIDILIDFATGRVEGYKFIKKTINFSTFDIDKKYFNDVKGFVELKLKLPRLDGNYDGIPEINKYFVGKEQFFYNELPIESLKEFNIKVEGEKDTWYRSANYKLEAVFENIISVSADLNGGAGGVGWAGIEADSFDLNTGKKLSLKDIFKVSEDEYMNIIYDFVSKKIMNENKSNKQAGYGSCYMFEDAYSGDGYKSIRDFDPNDFYLSKNALVVFYPKYALADGAAGPQKFEIPYESISVVLVFDVKS